MENGKVYIPNFKWNVWINMTWMPPNLGWSHRRETKVHLVLINLVTGIKQVIILIQLNMFCLCALILSQSPLFPSVGVCQTTLFMILDRPQSTQNHVQICQQSSPDNVRIQQLSFTVDKAALVWSLSAPSLSWYFAQPFCHSICSTRDVANLSRHSWPNCKSKKMCARVSTCSIASLCKWIVTGFNMRQARWDVSSLSHRGWVAHICV